MYEDRSPEAIKKEVMEDIHPAGWDTREGSFADDQTGPLAVQLSKVYDSFNALQYMIWVDATSGEYLDMESEDLGIEPRKLGERAEVSLLITGEPGYRLSSGTMFLTDSNLYFLTVEDAIIPAIGSVVVDAEAHEPGSAYNVAANTITNKFGAEVSIDSVTNLEAAQGGVDTESDASLFSRIDFARKKPRTSGNKHDYEEWAREVDGVGVAKCYSTYYGRGTVMVLIADENRQPVDEAVRQRCEDHILEEMPAGGIALTVLTPSKVTITASAVITTDGSITLTAAKEAWALSLSQYFAEIALQGSEVIYNQAGALLIAIDGVADYDNEQLLINGERDNITISAEQVPALGEVTVT